MSTELHHIELGRLSTLGVFSDRLVRPGGQYLKSGLLGLAVLLIAVLGVWLIWLAYDSDSVESEPAQSSTVAIETLAPSTRDPSPTVASPPGVAAPDPAASEERPTTAGYALTPAAEAPPVNGLSISSQSWRRGGLGSKALVTFTLRNNNDYAVKDIELACAFARRDGSHLTDRKRIIPDFVNMKNRETFAHVLVGFVNVNASRAKCVPVAANRS
jgi:hypothetical protein